MPGLSGLFGRKAPKSTKRADCDGCGKPIAEGDYYGYEKESSSLAISGFLTWYFCRTCIEAECTTRPIEECLGQTFIISRRNGERNRILIAR